MTTANLEVLASVRADKMHKLEFQDVWKAIYTQNKSTIDGLFKLTETKFICFDLKDEILSPNGSKYDMPSMTFDVPLELVTVNSKGQEHRKPFVLRITFDDSAIKWDNIDAFTDSNLMNLAPMFNFGFSSKRTPKGELYLVPKYTIDDRFAMEYVTENIFDCHAHAVLINNPTSVRYVEGEEIIHGEEIVVIGGYYCLADHKERIMKSLESKPTASNKVESLMPYLQNKAVSEQERIAKVNEKFKATMTYDGQTGSRFDLFFTRHGYTPTTLPNLPKSIVMFKSKMNNGKTIYLSPLIGLLIQQDGTYGIIYNLFEESIAEATERLQTQKMTPLADLVSQTDLRSK